MDQLFEVISKEEFESSGADVAEPRMPSLDRHKATAPDVNLEWCEFCKGYYIMEYHYGESDDEPSR